MRKILVLNEHHFCSYVFKLKISDSTRFHINLLNAHLHYMSSAYKISDLDMAYILLLILPFMINLITLYVKNKMAEASLLPKEREKILSWP